ncbi:hypothetical protein OH76DRAFT_1482405 [Lentinus brumalis]|uniref:Uncharacterized protein n=1 Tax=Lentinus brumalis TaxID=2498619 RepID=A0A371DCI2_9APHY|nr:hypothetical protein OH76DRAFT_1482405 [Polyporus brumalis]
MSDYLPQQNAAANWQRSAFPKTPGGSTVWVKATPIAVGRQNDNADALDSAASPAPPLLPLTPLIIRDTFDLSTPSPPPATQRPPRSPLQVPGANVVEDGGVQLRADSGAVADALRDGVRGLQVSLICAVSPAVLDVVLETRASVSPFPPLSPVDAAGAVDLRLSPSPINVSWDTTAESISPSVRAAAARTRAGNVPVATGGLNATAAAVQTAPVHAAEPRFTTPAVTAILAGGAAAAPDPEDDGPVPDADAAAFGRLSTVQPPGRPDTAALVLSGEGDVVLVQATGEPLYDGLAGAKTRTQWNVVGEDLEDDYFRFFTTPPAFTEEVQRTRNNGDAAGDAYVGRQNAHDGELTSCLLPSDVPRTACKRTWAGSPDPEDELRALRRPRPAGTTPAMRSEALPSNALDEVRNPWVEEEAAVLERDGVGETISSFVPVASSTPSRISVARPDMSSRRRLSSRLDQSLTRPLTMPRPSVLTNNSRPLPSVQEDSGVLRRVQDPDARPTEPEPPMDVDVAPSRLNAEPRDAPRKGKGKARATSAEIDQLYEEPAETRAEQNVQDGWDPEQLAEARNASLAHAARSRAGNLAHDGHGRYNGQSEGAGSSRSGLEPNRAYTRMTHESLPAVREEPTSRSYGSDDYRTRGPGLDVNDSAANRGYGRADWSVPQHRHASRARSEYFPAPNTRAADFLASRTMLQQSAAPHRLHATGRDIAHSPVDDGRMPMQNRREPGERGDELPDGRLHDRYEMLDEGDLRREREDTWENGQIDEHGDFLPMALWGNAMQEDDVPSPTPDEGFPPVHHDDPEAHLRGMALEWLREVWNDPPSSDVLVHVYNYRYTEDDALNRRVAGALRWAFERITGEAGFDVVPPEPEEGASRRSRDLPTLWAIRGLTPGGTAAAVSRGVWSYQTISFFASSRAAMPQQWLFALEGFLEGNAQKIRAAVLRVLQEESMERWLIEMLSTHPAYEGRSTRRAMSDLLSSLRVDLIQLGNGNYVANVFMRSPTRNLRVLRTWLADLRSRRYRSFAIGTGRVRYIAHLARGSSAIEARAMLTQERVRGLLDGAEMDTVNGEESEAETLHEDVRTRTHLGAVGVIVAAVMAGMIGTSGEAEAFPRGEAVAAADVATVDAVAAATRRNH